MSDFDKKLDTETVPLRRHYDIVRAIHQERARDEFLLSVLIGRQAEDGHRYFGERCVWCGINYLDHLIEENPEACVGPAPGEWSDDWWPLEKMDALLSEHRRKVTE